MKQLTKPAAPESLSNFRHGLHQWHEYITVPENRDDIWKQIDLMQNGFCAYCECRLNIKKRVEHFRNRSNHVTLTFSWDNLFGSCDHKSSCDIHKDARKTESYDPSEIIKPDEDNPSEYLIFLTTGRVIVRSYLSPEKQKRGEETLRVFNLDHDTLLVNRRRGVLNAELQTIQEFYELQDEFSNDEWLALLEDQITELQGREFHTTLKHAWQYNKEY